MRKWFDRLVPGYEAVIFLGLLPWISVHHLPEGNEYSWKQYLGAFPLLVLVQLPVLIFSWKRRHLEQRLSIRQYRLLWLACFALYLPAVLISASSLMTPGSAARSLIIACAGFSLLTGLLLAANTFYRKKLQQAKWIKGLSIEKALLLSIVLVSVIFSVMAVSSMGNPAYDFKDRLLLGYEFSPRKVLARFDVFLSFAVQFLVMYLCGYLFFYLNNKVLVPGVLKKRGLILYVLSAFAAVGILYPVVAQVLVLLPIDKRLGGIFPQNPFKTENAYAASAIVLFSLPIVLSLRWSQQNSRIIALEKEKAQTELDLLKQQLNPHFFFNTLNNLYALSLQRSEQTPESILQLSELMRYVIYKAKEPQVTIREEVKYLEDYLQLQQIRMKKKPDVQFVQEIGSGAAPIAPLLLIVLVENAFKHGIEPAENNAFLHLTLNATDHKLRFVCKNSFEEQPVAGSGIGLDNLRRRLALLYPGRHRFKTGSENHIFKAELELELS